MKDCTELIKACPYITMDEHHSMKALASKLPSHQRVVMIGAGPGELLLSFLEGYRYSTAKCTVVDKDTCEYVEAHVVSDNAVDEAYVGNIDYVIGYSQVIARDWNDPIDFLIIDGDHTVKGVQKDIQGWAKWVRKYIWFHDYNGPDGSDEARQIIDAYAVLAKWTCIESPGYSKVFKV